MEEKKRKKEMRINIRLTQSDLLLLRTRAERDGLPYQTLVASVIHRYVTGQLVSTDDFQKASLLIS